MGDKHVTQKVACAATSKQPGPSSAGLTPDDLMKSLLVASASVSILDSKGLRALGGTLQVLRPLT